MVDRETQIEQRMALQKQKQIATSLHNLAKNSTRENQRLDALRCAWTARLTCDAIQNSWSKFYDDECGAIVELDRIIIPFSVVERKKKKQFRRAIYVVAKIGRQVQDTELYTFNREVSEVIMGNKLVFQNVAPNFELSIEVYGLELPEKEKLKNINPDQKFSLWGSLKVGQEDMTNQTMRKNLRVTPHAPKVHALTAKFDLRLAGAVPALCDVLKEGFLNLWCDDRSQWDFVYVKLRNGKLYGYDPSVGKSKGEIFSVELTGDLKISESSKKRANSFQLRDFHGRTILAATCKSDMQDWIAQLRKHKNHLKRWGRIGNYEEPETNDVPDCDKPWSAFFMKDTKVTVIKTGVNVGKPEKKNKRRSRSIGDRIDSTPVRTTDPISSRRRRSNSIETPTKSKDRLARRDWMVPENKALPGFTGMALPDRYDPPTIVISDDDDLDMPDETINDVLDKVGHLEIIENSTRKNPRRDTDVFHKAIQERTAKLASQKVVRAPLRTSTQINKSPEKIRVQTRKVQFGGMVQKCTVAHNNHAEQFHESIHPDSIPSTYVSSSSYATPSSLAVPSYRFESIQNPNFDAIRESDFDSDLESITSARALAEKSKKHFSMPRFKHLEG